MAETKTERRKPDGEALRKEGKRWIERIEASAKLEKTWLDDAEKAVAAYTGEGLTEGATAGKFDFNILYANVETIVPAIINSPPQPDIRRRFADDDPVAKDGSELLERTIRIQVDDSRLQIELEQAAHDAFLAGRGLVRLRFKADVSEGSDELRELAEDFAEESPGGRESAAKEEPGDEAESGDGPTVKNERLSFEAVSWRDYRHGPAKRWEDRPWDAFRHAIPMEDLEAFADKAITDAQSLPEDKLEKGETDNDVVVWEVWSKKDRRVWFVEETTGKILKIIHDPLGLKKFFPICTPMQPIELTARLMPVNPFAIYRKLADELDITTRRIAVITNQMRVRGWYAGDATELANMLDAGDVDFVPVANPELWASHGGIEKAVAFWPIDKFIQALRELYANREQTKQAIYEITGISDIVRGATRATETATAQQIKSQWGSLRIQKMQRMMERAARDLFVMMAEIIPDKFSAETLQAMTGIQLKPTPQDLAPIPPPPAPPAGQQLTPEMQQQLQQAQAQHQQMEQQRRQKLAHMEALNHLLNDDVTRMYRIDVESDSTVRADLTQKKQEQAEFLQGSAAFFQSAGPAVDAGVISKEGAIEIYAATARLFTLGKSTEDALDREITKAREAGKQPPQPSPEQQKAQAEQQASQAEFELRQQEAQAKALVDGKNAETENIKALTAQETQAVENRIKEAKAADDALARQMERDDKRSMAELERSNAAQRHAQDMEKGTLELQLLQEKIAQTEAGTDKTIATTAASLAAAAQPEGNAHGG
jgi:hypothetical protein